MRDRWVLRDAMALTGERGSGRATACEQRLSEIHPELEAGELRDVLLYCRQVDAAAWLCAKQVDEGGMTFEAGAGCLAEQFPELDMDQVEWALRRATLSLEK